MQRLRRIKTGSVFEHFWERTAEAAHCLLHAGLFRVYVAGMTHFQLRSGFLHCMLLIALTVSACGGTTAMTRCPGTDPSSRQECMVSDSPGLAVAHAAAASAILAVGGGCAINGCLPPMVCDGSSGLCKSPRCAEGKSCPAGYTCDMQAGVCK